MLKKLKNNKIKAQILSTSFKVEYLLLESNNLIPIYPKSLDLKLPIIYMDKVYDNLPSNILKVLKFYLILDEELGRKFDYVPELLIVNDNIIQGFILKNGLIVPVKNVLYK